ncbi:MAG: toprim domain-containing protein, partial [Pseudomonadota bacterium]
PGFPARLGNVVACSEVHLDLTQQPQRIFARVTLPGHRSFLFSSKIYGPALGGRDKGIESTLSALQLLDKPEACAWATLSTSGMKTVDLPETAGELIIAADGDAPGRAAGADLAERASSLGWKVSIADPGDGQDWNDVLCTGQVAA